MGTFFEKRPTASTSVDDIVSARSPDVAAPGKRTNVDADSGGNSTPARRASLADLRRLQAQGSLFNDPYADHGPACRGRNDGDCFLGDAQRGDVMMRLSKWVSGAQTNYKLAILELKVDELIKKEEDLSFAVSLLLDLAGAHLIATVGTAIKSLQARGMDVLSELSVNNMMAGLEDSKWAQRAGRALAMVTPTRADMAVRSGFVAGVAVSKKKAQAKQNEDLKTTKEATVSYLDQLRDRCDVAFDSTLSQLLADATDAELVLAFESFRPEHHTVGAYKAALKAKLDRFFASGVLDIGRKQTTSPGDAWNGEVIRDTRVVYVQDINGRKTPWFQRQDGPHTPDVASPGDPMYERIDPMDPEHQAAWSKFGPRHAGRAQLDKPVPEEFQEAAILRSEARWGPTPVIDDGYVALLKQQGVSVKDMHERLSPGGKTVKSGGLYQHPSPLANVAPPLPSGSIFEERPPQQSPHVSLPSASIFEVKKT